MSWHEPLGVREVARALGVSRFTVYDLIKRGDLPAYRVGNRLRVEPAALAAFKRAGALGAPDAPGRMAAAVPRVAGLQLAGVTGPAREVRLEDLRAGGGTTVTATRLGAQSFTQHRYRGVLLQEVLTGAGLTRPVTAWRAALSHYVLATGADGHAVVIALGEIDPAYGNVPVLIAWDCDGAPLSDDEGPLVLVVPSDHRGGRYVRRLVALTVRDGARPPDSAIV